MTSICSCLVINVKISVIWATSLSITPALAGTVVIGILIPLMVLIVKMTPLQFWRKQTSLGKRYRQYTRTKEFADLGCQPACDWCTILDQACSVWLEISVSKLPPPWWYMYSNIAQVHWPADTRVCGYPMQYGSL